MTFLKFSLILFFCILSPASFGSQCEIFQGFQLQEKLCWDKSIRGWLSFKCLNHKQACLARDFFQEKKTVSAPEGHNGQNPAAMICHTLKLNVLILKDTQGNEQSFCRFSDQTIVDANAVERNVK